MTSLTYFSDKDDSQGTITKVMTHVVVKDGVFKLYRFDALLVETKEPIYFHNRTSLQFLEDGSVVIELYRED